MNKGKKFVDDIEKCSKKVNSNVILNNTSNNGNGIVNINDNIYYDVNTELLRKSLDDFESDLNSANCKLDLLKECYDLLDQAYEWALNTMRYVASMKIENLHTKNGLEELYGDITKYISDNPLFDEAKFDHMCDLARKVGNQKLIDKCESVKIKCIETLKWLELRQNTIIKIKNQNKPTQTTLANPKSSLSQTSLDKIDEEESSVSSLSMSNEDNDKMDNTLTLNQPQMIIEQTPVKQNTTAKQTNRFFNLFSFKKRKNRISLKEGANKEDKNQSLSQYDLPSICSQAQQLDAEHQTRPQNYRHSYSFTESFDESKCNCTCVQKAEQLTFSDGNLNESKTRSYSLNTDKVQFRRNDPNRHTFGSIKEKTCENENEVGNETILADLNQTKFKNVTSMYEQQKDSLRSNSLPHRFVDNNHENALKLSGNQILSKNFEKVINELLQTEKDYVHSLNYVIENFIPEMKQPDIPQLLRGKSSVIFGNIEMIYTFHFNHFLQELVKQTSENTCTQSAAISIANCFLNHRNDFHLYALYSKNKPKSDSLMLEIGAQHFKRKQLELGDYLDLSSYLLKPVQRLGKYALLLRQLIKEFPLNSLEYAKLKQAEELMKFQLRHGNDLLAMDCIRDSDINLLEQGQLIRQDEMIVQIGNLSNGTNENGTFSFSISQLRSKKSLRRVFLFEDVIVFTKIKKNLETKQDIYLYRNSLKLSDIGMTENIGSNELKFEIWFRRYNYGNNYVLQAPNMEVKQAWISNIHMLLDRQMQKVKEKRLIELTSMGLGSKPCSDLPPSSNQIIDRSINIPIRNARIRNSIAVSHFDSQTSIKCLNNPNYNTFKIVVKENEDVSKRPTSTVSITSTHTSGLSSFASSASSQFNQQLQQQNNQTPQSRTHRSHTIAGLSFHQDDQDNKSKTLQSLASNESGIVPDILKDCCTNNEKILHIDHESNQSTNNSEYDKINV